MILCLDLTSYQSQKIVYKYLTLLMKHFLFLSSFLQSFFAQRFIRLSFLLAQKNFDLTDLFFNNKVEKKYYFQMLHKYNLFIFKIRHNFNTSLLSYGNLVHFFFFSFTFFVFLRQLLLTEVCKRLTLRFDFSSQENLILTRARARKTFSPTRAHSSDFHALPRKFYFFTRFEQDLLKDQVH
jgi:hypothetical protein